MLSDGFGEGAWLGELVCGSVEGIGDIASCGCDLGLDFDLAALEVAEAVAEAELRGFGLEARGSL